MIGEQTADSRDFLKERIISSWYVLKDIHGGKWAEISLVL